MQLSIRSTTAYYSTSSRKDSEMSHDALKWMTSYFEGRTQTFRAGSEDSDPRALRFGVPQGSVAGPQTFVCYTEDLQEVVTSFEIGYHLYADDSQLLDKTTLQNLDACRLRIESCVESVREWFSSRRLKLNSDKRELICSARARCSRNSRALRRVSVSVTWRSNRSNQCEDLGVTLDCQLNMRAHISKIVSACYYHLRRIRQLRNCLDKDDRQKTSIGSRVVEDRLLQRRTCWITCDFTGSSPASHQRRCSLRRQPPTSRPCQPCSTRSPLAPNP